MPKWTDDQLKAINTSKTNIIVSAGAGSGKTAVLSSRVIERLKNNIHINELLILTFTNKAANEMKERIRANIKSNSSLKEELDLIDSSYITTFDSFALSIVKKYHYNLNIPKNIGITDDNIIKMKQKEIIDAIFQYFYSIDDEDFNKLINDFCIKDDKELKSLILEIASKIELLIDKDAYLDNYLNNYFTKENIDRILKDYENLILSKKEEVIEALENLKSLVDYKDYEKIHESLFSLINEEDIDKLLSIKINLPRATKNMSEEAKISKKILKKKIDDLLNYEKNGTKEEIINNIYLTKSTVSIIIDILKRYFKELTEYKNSNYIYNFQDIALLSINLLEKNKDVREEVKNSYKEIMIDEYQDTNDIQEAFISLISNNNVYMVGDIKQSIYRFRNANPFIFKSKYGSYAKNNGGIKIDLLQNFRSREEVLDNINLIFNHVMDGYIGGADYLVSHQMKYGNTTYSIEGKTNQNNNMEFLEYDSCEEFTNEEIEIFTIGRDILNKINNKYKVFDNKTKELHDATYKDFVIIMDRGTSFEHYKKIFEYLGIPLIIEKDEKLNEGYDLYLIKNLIDEIIQISKKNYDTKFKFNFISICRSYLYNLDDDEIFSYFLNNTFTESKIYKDLESISLNINSKSSFEILKEIIEKTNLYERLSTTDDLDNSLIRIEKLLETSYELSNLGYDIYKFNEYLGILIEDNYEIKYSLSNNNSNSVTITNIHKSKGLEYNICYFSGFEKKFNLNELKEKFTISNKYGLIVPFFKEGIRETIVKDLLKNDYIKEEISEKVRLLYVALTRAEEKMIFVLPKKDYINTYKNEYGVITNTTRLKYRSFLDIILSIKMLLNKYVININLKKLNLTKDYLFNKDYELKKVRGDEKLIVKELNILNVDVTTSSFSKKLYSLITKEEKDNLNLGLQVHEALELLDFKKPNYDLIENPFIKEKIKRFLSSKIMQNINNCNIYKEYEFMYIEDNDQKHGIIDLMLEYEDYINIIDYKLNNIIDDNYINQLNGYKNYINKVSNKKVNIYLYSIIKEEIKEII